MDIKCKKITKDNQETFNLSKQTFRDDFKRRLEKDVTLEIDFRSVL